TQFGGGVTSGFGGAAAIDVESKRRPAREKILANRSMGETSECLFSWVGAERDLRGSRQSITSSNSHRVLRGVVSRSPHPGPVVRHRQRCSFPRPRPKSES